MIFTSHAIDRLGERFPHVKEPISILFKEAELLHTVRADKFFVHKKYGIVFVVGDGAYVTTVLTDKQYWDRWKTIRRAKKGINLTNSEVKNLALRYYNTCGRQYPSKKERKRLGVELRSKGFSEDCIRRMWDTMMKINYEVHTH